jgi:hypothetical protein
VSRAYSTGPDGQIKFNPATTIDGATQEPVGKKSGIETCKGSVETWRHHQLPGYVARSMKGEIKIDGMIFEVLPLVDINDGFALIHAGKVIRSVIDCGAMSCLVLASRIALLVSMACAVHQRARRQARDGNEFQRPAKVPKRRNFRCRSQAFCRRKGPAFCESACESGYGSRLLCARYNDVPHS